ncbi:hypothetical protein ABT124_44485, partial [Streptomyces sp. NPDC001982]
GAPAPPAADGPSRILRRDRLGGLIHEYAQVAWGDVGCRHAQGDGKAEATADAVLREITLYGATVFPLTAGGASIKERRARRTIAYELAAYDDLPVSVRVAAAEALEAIDHGRDKARTRAAVRALNQAVRECRAGHVSVRDEQTS